MPAESDVRFYLDECLNPLIALIARRLGIDSTEWKTSGLQGASDEVQLRHAAASGRCIVTSNCRHFKRHRQVFQAAGEAHHGVLCLKTTQFDLSDAVEIAETLARFAGAHPEGLAPYEIGSNSQVIKGATL